MTRCSNIDDATGAACTGFALRNSRWCRACWEIWAATWLPSVTPKVQS